VFVREGSQHGLYRLGTVRVVIPRHSEINEMTAEAILKDLEGQLGKGWWR
jgi:mRNA interferase HicA